MSHRLLPRYQPPDALLAHAHRRHAQARVLRLVVDLELPIPTGPAGGDHLALRGIPAIGRNVAGAIAGTNPEAAACR